MAGDNKKLKFVPFSSTISPGFWYQLVDKKLNEFKLDSSPREIHGFYSNADISGIPCQHCVEFDSFEDKSTSFGLNTHGLLYNTNTSEDFKQFDKKKLLQSEADKLYDDIKNGNAILDPSLLARFFLLSFADLKKYHFFYWFGFPSFLKATDHFTVKRSCLLKDSCPEDALSSLSDTIHSFDGYKGFFIVAYDGPNFQRPTCHNLSQLVELVSSDRSLCFVFSDPSTLADYPGWPLRNLLLLITIHWTEYLQGKLCVLGLRCKSTHGRKSILDSLWLELTYNPTFAGIATMPDPVGWEKNHQQKLMPRQVHLADSMDPKRLAESAVNLNLKLMRWRLMPCVDLERISKSKCLLLGAGTLGCNVARALLGWGVKTITLVDNGTVSFSNPVRQSLFEFSDCSTAGGRPKAIAAAEKLQKIFPGVEANGIELSIPMPGHPVNSNEKTSERARNDVDKLISLIQTHDAVFLLMDTRESRWLPTVLAAAEKKLVINAALGFDSYLIMRHGVDNVTNEVGACKSAPKLGCYFCNDVVAPGNSLRDRTLDQQCTVSRPGVSMIAAAYAAELFVSVIQHEDGAHYLPSLTGDDVSDLPLGMIPHQIRGYLSNYQMLLPTTYSFSKCTACSEFILSNYADGKIDFLLEVFNSPPKYLEDITGLTLLHLETAAVEEQIIELSDCESV